MVGGYVMIPTPDVLFNPEFESGTKVPGLYKILEAAHATGKTPVCYPMNRVPSYSPFTFVLLKNNGILAFSVDSRMYRVSPDDTVIIE